MYIVVVPAEDQRAGTRQFLGDIELVFVGSMKRPPDTARKVKGVIIASSQLDYPMSLTERKAYAEWLRNDVKSRLKAGYAGDVLEL